MILKDYFQYISYISCLAPILFNDSLPFPGKRAGEGHWGAPLSPSISSLLGPFSRAFFIPILVSTEPGGESKVRLKGKPYVIYIAKLMPTFINNPETIYCQYFSRKNFQNLEPI
jgi:hypothetical protein